MNLGSRMQMGGRGECCDNTHTCDPRRVTSIYQTGDQVIITFDNCTYIAAPKTVVDQKSFVDMSITEGSDNCKAMTELSQKLDAVTEALKKAVCVGNLAGVPIFTAGPPNGEGGGGH